ncbi:cytochrome P450 [Mycena sp. CBHHK59/15]|nr:cytochrome P450 [Mycena sp. CBHHK59/15]
MAYLLNFFYVLATIAAYWLIKPPSPSFVFGHTKEIMGSRNPADLYGGWAQTYGSVYQVRGPLGTGRFVVCDPKAIAHVYALDSWKYCHTPLARQQLSSLTGPNSLLIALGEEHSRQRKILNPVFGSAALKTYSSIMYDSAYKVFTAWESELQASTANEIIIDISEWQALHTLDSPQRRFDVIGLAAFSHDFKSLDGEKSAVATALTALGHSKPSPKVAKILLLSQAYPVLLKLPLPRSALVADLSNAMDAVVDGLTESAKSAKNTDNSKSALGVLLNEKELSAAQVRVHAKSTLLAGFATTSSASLWALVELSMRPEKQDRLRAELSSFTTTDPSYDDLTKGLPYLDAIVRETLRLHPVLSESTRVALEDDILPLSKPVRTASGTLIYKLPIRKGAVLTTSILYTNLSKTIWGEDAADFKPERWLNDSEGVPASAKEYPGYHHTMTFLEGPKTCLGKGFAIAEMKIVLSLLIRMFVFSSRDGKETKYEKALFLGPHPKVAGEPGGQLPMRVKRVE